MIPILTAILTPIAGQLVKHFLEPKIAPIVEAVKDIEKITPDATNQHKLDQVLRMALSNKAIYKFITKCGWDKPQLEIVINFCVLLVKKPITDESKWNDDDYRVVFDFLRVIANKWIPMLWGKK